MKHRDYFILCEKKMRADEYKIVLGENCRVLRNIRVFLLFKRAI